MAIKAGDKVRFSSNYGPGTEYRTMTGTVVDAGVAYRGQCTRNPTVMTELGGIVIRASSLTVIE